MANRCRCYRSKSPAAWPSIPTATALPLGTEWFLRAFDAHGNPLWSRPVPSIVWAVNITGDGRLVVAAYADGTIRWHRMSDGVELLAFMPLPDQSNWVAWTPEGFYTATDEAKDMLRWQVNRGWNPADSVPVENIPGYERSTLPQFVLQELETPRTQPRRAGGGEAGGDDAAGRPGAARAATPSAGDRHQQLQPSARRIPASRLCQT
jgi:hypothetical protein